MNRRVFNVIETSSGRSSNFATIILAVFFAVMVAGCADDGDAAAPPPTSEIESRTSPDAMEEGSDATEASREAARSAQAETVLAHPHDAYERLKEARDRYTQIVDRGGWPTLSEGDVLAKGDTSERVPALRERLKTTGDLRETSPAADSAFDAALASAIAGFQQRHGLTVDSLLGPNTRSALNVPADERLATIERNLKRWESLPDTLGERYVLVNIPEFRLRVFERGEMVQTMEVIVGAEYDGRATPVFRDSIEHLIFSPYWNIPHSIATEEILPKARENRDYLTQNDYEIVSSYGPNAEVFDTYGTSLSRVESGDLRLRQAPGPQNALGLVKFMFPNQYAIYLHGTPADQLFARAERDFSHGCIRVERPLDLAVFALSRQSEWDRQRIDEAMHNGEWQLVELDDRIPVYIYYWTAFVDRDGAVQFREDIYGHDKGEPGFDLS